MILIPLCLVYSFVQFSAFVNLNSQCPHHLLLPHFCFNLVITWSFSTAWPMHAMLSAPLYLYSIHSYVACTPSPHLPSSMLPSLWYSSSLIIFIPHKSYLSAHIETSKLQFYDVCWWSGIIQYLTWITDIIPKNSSIFGAGYLWERAQICTILRGKS